MDELFDLFDAVAALDDVHELADHADSLLEALRSVDYINLDAADLQALDDLAAFGTQNATDLASSFEHSEFWETSNSYAGFLTDGNWAPLDETFGSNILDADTVSEFVATELAGYPPVMLEGLSGIAYEFDPCPGKPNLLGEWSLNNGSAHINLFDHQESVDTTLHHEMAHHLMGSDAGLLSATAPHAATSPMLEHFEIDFSAYAPEEQRSEFAAEAFAYFKAKPELLQQIDPELHEAIAKWWQKHANLA